MAVADNPLIRQAELLAGLLDEEEATAAALLRTYAAVYGRLVEAWQQLFDEIERLRDSGRDDAAILLLRSQRVALLMVQTAREVDVWAQDAERRVRDEQETATSAAVRHSAEILALVLLLIAPEIRYRFTIPSPASFSQFIGRFSNGMPLRNLFRTFGPNAASDALGALVRTVAGGVAKSEGVNLLQVALQVPLRRARTTSRTETISVYRDTTIGVYRANEELVRGWRWNAHLDARTCLACLVLHGTVHPIEERMNEHPNGRCVPSPIMLPRSELVGIGMRDAIRRQNDMDRTGLDYWDRLSAEEQRRRAGPRKYALMRTGKLDLTDLVVEETNPLWGPEFREATIDQALDNHRLGLNRFTYDVEDLR